MNRHCVVPLMLLFTVLVPLGAQQRVAEINPKNAMKQARADMDAGRLLDAVKLYDAVIASQSRDAAKYKADALYGAAIVRLSPDTSVMDLAGAQAALNQLMKSDPRSAHRQESAAFLHLLDETARRVAEAEERAAKTLASARAAQAAESAELQKRIAGLTQNIEAMRSESEGGKGEADKLRQAQATLRTENRNLRDQLTRTQAELEKKDAALRKIAGSIVK